MEPNVSELEREIERQFKAHKIQCTVPHAAIKEAVEGANREWTDMSFIPLAQRGEAQRILLNVMKEYMQDFKDFNKKMREEKKERKKDKLVGTSS